MVDLTEKDPVDCVGVICFRGDDVLLIKRGTAPRKGEWSLPGGRIEAGESEREAALRELMEETSVTATLGAKVAVIDAKFEGFHYRLHDYVSIWTAGEPRAGDDAARAEFVPPERLDALGMWPKTREVIETARAVLGDADKSGLNERSKA
ncbi:NUDIX hydrolase [Fretibacter rubidus]|uniref:NUDIX hydrolase n=1 Tax=Fretibacter rubidus TaxID=570162 RepID=UPI003529FD3F